MKSRANVKHQSEEMHEYGRKPPVLVWICLMNVQSHTVIYEEIKISFWLIEQEHHNDHNRIILTHCSLGDLDVILKTNWSLQIVLWYPEMNAIGHTDDKSRYVQVMAWCYQVTSHWLKQYWPRSIWLYGIYRPQWVNSLRVVQYCFHFADNIFKAISLEMFAFWFKFHWSSFLNVKLAIN